VKRKVNQLGTSLSITLPSKWVKTIGIKKGDDVDIDIANNSLIVHGEGNLFLEESTEISVKKGSLGYVKSMINNVYRKGYDEVLVHYEDEATKKLILEALEETMGFEVVEQKENKLVIKNIAGLFESEFDNLMRRAFLITISIAEESLIDLKQNKIDKEKYWQLKKTVEKLMNVCCRTLNKGVLRNNPNSKFRYLVIHTIDKIAYAYYYIISLEKEPLSPPLLVYYANTTAYLRAFYDNYYQKNIGSISLLTDKKNTLLWEEGYRLMKKANVSERIVLHHLMTVIRRTYECMSPFLGEQL